MFLLPSSAEEFINENRDKPIIVRYDPQNPSRSTMDFT